MKTFSGFVYLALLLICPWLAQARTTISLNSGWKFTQSNPAGAETIGFPDQDWQAIALPHSWSGAIRGTGWYRLSFRPPAHKQKRLFLRVGAANQIADVYVNGRHIGQHLGGYTAFTFDLTDSLLDGRDNLIAIRVDNSPGAEIAPISADYTFFGGIYRDIALIVTDEVHVSLLDDSSMGFYLTPIAVSEDEARVSSRLLVVNEQDHSETIEAQVDLVEDGSIVQRLIRSVELPAHSTLPVDQEFKIAHPHLWRGRKDPHLYRVRARVMRKRGASDEVSQPLGIRFYTVDANNGFQLNGEHLELRGVNMHQDWEGKGWALSHSDRRKNIELLTELGANAIRLSHYPHSEETLDLLDRAGFAVWAEIPMINKVHASPAFAESTKQQLRELIHQQYNHPSIFFWSLFNEIDGDPVGLVGELNALAKSLDPSRLTTGASNQAFSNPLNFITDVIAINRYDGWYSGKSEDIAGKLEEAKKVLYPKPLGLSEYGAGGSLYQHEYPAQKPQAGGPFHPEEYQTAYHETYFAALEQQKSLWGHFVWNLFDFSSWGRNEGDAPHINDKGLISYDRQTKKDAFYFYKAHWNPQPMVYITSRRFVNRPSNSVEVKVYSNQPVVEILVNGKSLGTKSADTIFTWTNVALQPGENYITARTPAGNVDSVTWRAP